MTSLVLSLPLTPTPTRARTVASKLALSSLRQSHPFPRIPLRLPKPLKTTAASFAYVSGPASDAIVSEPDPKLDESDANVQPPSVIGWGLLWSLLLKHKLRLAVAAFALIGCSACTLSMPIFSGTKFNFASKFQFFACLVAEKFEWTERKIKSLKPM